MKAAIGVDIGGGSVKLGLVSAKGKILARDSFKTSAHLGRAGLLSLLEASVKRLAAHGRGVKIQGVGIGAPGPIDVERGLVYFFPNIPGWKNTPLKKILERRLKMPVFVDNDANVMALGESVFGAGRGVRSAIALTLGTGVGGGLILDGRLFHGAAFSAAELGHIIINEDGPRCGCGNQGCIETYVGSQHFIRAFRQRLKRGEKSVLKTWIRKGETLSPLLVAKAAKQGDPFAKKMWEETAGHLATALAGLVNTLNPERIIVGGGIAQNGAILFRPLVRSLNRKTFPIAARSVKVMPAILGVDAGLIGAACLVFVNE